MDEPEMMIIKNSDAQISIYGREGPFRRVSMWELARNLSSRSKVGPHRERVGRWKKRLKITKSVEPHNNGTIEAE